MPKPKRIQRKRTKGWRMPPSAVYVGRPTRWGNPFKAETCGDPRSGRARALAVSCFRVWLDYPHNAQLRAKIRRELRGKDLACWCQPGAPCHADVLLDIANA